MNTVCTFFSFLFRLLLLYMSTTSKLQIVGAPFSTFSRTMRMALRYAKINYEFIETLPHSKEAYKHNPFGRIPSLIYNGKSIFETLAIKDFLETKYEINLTPKDLDKRLQMDQIISALGDYVFHKIIFGVAKPRAYYEEKNKTEEEIAKLLEKPLKTSASILKAFDTIISQEGPFLCGEQLTWADYFVYPVMADLYSLPERDFFKQQAPTLFKWFEGFKAREEVEYTYPNTVADMRSNL